jgi:hypothetical protein
MVITTIFTETQDNLTYTTTTDTKFGILKMYYYEATNVDN